jgi:glycosyltransferase involved in cell wall biosynthesis
MPYAVRVDGPLQPKSCCAVRSPVPEFVEQVQPSTTRPPPEVLKLKAVLEATREALRRSNEVVSLLRTKIDNEAPQQINGSQPRRVADTDAGIADAHLIAAEQARLSALREEAARLSAAVDRMNKDLRWQQHVLPGWMTLFGTADVLAKKVVATMERDGFIPDVAIGHDTLSLETLELLKQRFGTLTIFDAMEMPVLRQRSGSYFRNLPRAAHEMIQPRLDHNILRVDRVITIGPAMARRLTEIYYRDIEVVLNSRSGPPAPRSDDLRRHVGAADDDTLCLFGNLIAEDYGFEEVIGAFAHLPERFKLVNVGGFGGRGYERKTREMIAATGYAHRILFGDSVPFDAVPNLFSGADLGIISFKASLSENDKYALPNRFFDYCAAGLPIFTTRIEDIADYVLRYEAGTVFNELTPRVIANTILSSVENLTRWRANSARLAEDLRWEKAGRDFIESLGPPGLSIAIIIRRDITIHGRTHRTHRSLTDRGHTVRVFTTSGTLPGPVGMRDVVHIAEKEW